MASPGQQDLAFTRGDDFQIDITMTATTGGPGISVSGWSAMKAMLRHRADDSKLAQFTIAIQNTAGGIIRFSLTSGQTQTLPTSAVWDIERVSSGQLQTVGWGNVTIRPDITYGT